MLEMPRGHRILDSHYFGSSKVLILLVLMEAQCPSPGHRMCLAQLDTRTTRAAPPWRSDLLLLEAWAANRPDTGAPWDANASMLFRRLKVYHYTTRIPKPPKGLKTCSRCFAELLLSSSTNSSYSWFA
jgi:hypothetical protein